MSLNKEGKTYRFYRFLDRVICELFFGDPLVLPSVQPEEKKFVSCLPFFKVSKPFERLVVFKELSEGAKENAKLLELEIVVPVLPIPLDIWKWKKGR